MNEKRKTKSVRLRVPAPPNLCGRFPRKDHLQWPDSARVRCEKTNDRFSISVVSSRDGQRAGRCPVRRRCTRGISSCTSRQTVYAVGPGGVVKAHPKWQSTKSKKQNKKARNLSVSGP